jgi:hypothetical protein
MGDPSDSDIRPDRATIELAMRVAEHKRGGERPGSYWHGAVDALAWTLGQSSLGPVSHTEGPVDLDGPARRLVRWEAEAAYACMTGLQRTELGMRYLTGVENTCMWVATGSGFAESLDRDWLRNHMGIQ